MPRLRKPHTDPAAHDWLVENVGGWSISPETVESSRPYFGRADLNAVRAAVLERLDVSGSALRSACSLGSRKIRRQGNSFMVGVPPEVLHAAGVGEGDSLEFTPLPDGRIELRRAPDVDRDAVRARIRDAGVAPRLLARLFFVPETTVRRIVKGAQ